MVVDFVVRKAPEYKVATRILRGTWPGDRAIRSEFEKVLEWAKVKGVRTGKWIFRELDGPETPSAKRRWEVDIEVRGKGPVRGGKGVSIKTIPSGTAVTVTFNPDAVAARLVYHGLADWLSWRKKEKEYREAGPSRGVYIGNPWSSKRAWAHTQVQVPLKKLSG